MSVTAAMAGSGNPPNAVYRRFEGMREYEALTDAMIPQTQQVIRVFDRMLSRDWNRGERIELLSHFLRRARENRLFIILHDARRIAAEQPRLLELARHFGHACVIRETLKQAKHVYDPFVLFDGSHYLHRFHYSLLRAAQGLHDAVGNRQLLGRFEEISEFSGPPMALGAAGL
ncbi:MAG: hypothetical protein ACK59Y_12865 [Betaproteobacteria bacterium]|jgi:hypothetical protein